MNKLNKKEAALRQDLLMILILAIFVFSIFLVVAAKDQELLVNLRIPDEYRKAVAGGNMLTETDIVLLNEVREDKVIDLLIEFSLIDSNEKTVFKLSETKGSILRSQLLREFRLPLNLNPGLYILKVKVSYDGVFREDSELFEIVDPQALINLQDMPKEELTKELERDFIIYVISIIFMIFVGVLYYEHKKFKQIETIIGKVNEKNLSDNNFIISTK